VGKEVTSPVRPIQLNRDISAVSLKNIRPPQNITGRALELILLIRALVLGSRLDVCSALRTTVVVFPAAYQDDCGDGVRDKGRDAHPAGGGQLFIRLATVRLRGNPNEKRDTPGD